MPALSYQFLLATTAKLPIYSLKTYYAQIYIYPFVWFYSYIDGISNACFAFNLIYIEDYSISLYVEIKNFSFFFCLNVNYDFQFSALVSSSLKIGIVLTTLILRGLWILYIKKLEV